MLPGINALVPTFHPECTVLMLLEAWDAIEYLARLIHTCHRQ